MKLRVLWTPPAQGHLAELHDYISESNYTAADRQVELVVEAAAALADFPQMGRPGRRVGTRELVVPGTPYIVAYRIKLATIEVLAVMHGAQRWPRRFS